MLLSNNGGSYKTYVDDIFSVQLRTGNGTSQSVTTGFQPDLVWTKSRSATAGHRLVDSARGVGNSLESNSTLAQQSEAAGITAFNSTGYSVGADSDYNTNAATYVDWVWKKAPKFFDVVTFTTDANGRATFSHALGTSPGMIVLKATSTTSGWATWHRGLASTRHYVQMNTAAAQADLGAIWITSSETEVSVPFAGALPANATHVAYLFAHDTSADGIIQCGSYVGNGSGGQSINIGFEPQFLLIKNSSQTGDWVMFDMLRGMAVTTSNPLWPNTSGAESTGWTAPQPTATGFRLPDNTLNDNANTHIYLAIRRPNKPPTSGTEVFTPIAMTPVSGGAFSTNFPIDLVIATARQDVYSNDVQDRLRGFSNSNTFNVPSLITNGTNAEADFYPVLHSVWNNQAVSGQELSGLVSVFWVFRRAPGFFSSFAYTGTGTNRTTPHDLAAIPDLLIVKSRSAATDWQVWFNGLAANEKLVLNSNAGKVTDATAWNNTLPTSTNISLGTASATNANNATFIAYAFSNLPGIQKIGTYVGDGTSGRVIDCGFTTGARFVCIKAVSTTGSWLVSDTARGITSSADPYLQLNSTEAEITTEDWLDPSSVGFIVNNVTSSNANASGVTYMYWAIS